MLELRGAPFADPSILDVLQQLRGAGYTLALDDFRYTPELEPLLRMVDIIKLGTCSSSDLASWRATPSPAQPLRLEARGQQDPDLRRLQARASGWRTSIPGLFLLPPAPACRPRDRPEPPGLLRMASALQDPDIQLVELERLVSGDVALSYRLLKYINSAYFSLRGRISSIKQAVALLGIEPLRRWATLNIFAEVSDKPRELFVTALIRARFCQQAGPRTARRPSCSRSGCSPCSTP